jgi:hypothetical protein
MDDPYTHIFKFFIGKNGENTLSGECEFDSDDKMTFDIKDTSTPITVETLAFFNELMSLIKRIYDSSGGVKQILIKTKVV